MILNTYTKQPVDRLDYDIDYVDWLSPGDSVLSAVAAVDPIITGGLTVETPLVDGTRVKVFANAGLTGSTYKVTVTMTTANARVKQDEFKVRVRDF